MRNPQLQELEGSPRRRRLLGGSGTPEGLLSGEGRVVASVCASGASDATALRARAALLAGAE